MDDAFAKSLERIPVATKARYWSSALNPTIRLGQLEVSLRAGTYRETYEALVSLVCQPTPQTVLEISGGISTELFFEAMRKDLEVEVLSTSSVPALPRKRITRSEPFVTYFPHTSFGDGAKLRQVHFGLFNFPDVIGSVVTTRRAQHRRAVAGRIELRSEEWLVVIDPMHDLSKRYQAARARRGYLLSHAGVFGRVDGASFTAERAEHVMSAIYWLISFALGRRTGPILPYATSHNRQKAVWVQWGARGVDPARGMTTWFDLHHPEALSAIFGPFMELWRQPDLQRILVRVISWYVQAQDIDPVEAAIPAAQIALETLAATIPGRPELDDPSLGSNAAGKLARLLKKTKIATEIPGELDSLCKASGPKAWLHGPDAITHLRNDITHPRQDRSWTSAAMIEAWKLSLWYVELTMLAWLGYRGQYNRRTRRDRWMGLVEPVPWSV